jgi:ferredoxin
MAPKNCATLMTMGLLVTITFRRTGLPAALLDVRPGALLLTSAVRARLPIGRSCRGLGACGACRVQILDGANQLTPPTEWEAALPGGERLACQARVFGPVTVGAGYW